MCGEVGGWGWWCSLNKPLVKCVYYIGRFRVSNLQCHQFPPENMLSGSVREDIIDCWVSCDFSPASTLPLSFLGEFNNQWVFGKWVCKFFNISRNNWMKKKNKYSLGMLKTELMSQKGIRGAVKSWPSVWTECSQTKQHICSTEQTLIWQKKIWGTAVQQ